MEGTCNECVFPLNKDQSEDTCPTDTSLIYAAATGRLSCVKELIAAGADANTTCECHGNGPLMAAAMDGNIHCMRELILAGADVNIQNTYKSTALLEAAFEGDLHTVKMLISAGANVNIEDRKKYTPLKATVVEGHVECLRVLIGAGADINKEDADGNTPLMASAILGKVDCLEELIAAGAEVNNRNVAGDMALFYSAFGGHTDIMKKLLKAGADTNPANNEGKTVLILAAFKGNTKCLRKLLAAGVDINEQDKSGSTALKTAAYAGHVECVTELIAVGAEIDKQDEDGNTSLIAAAAEGHVGCLRELMASGADTNIRREEGQTALYKAIYNEHTLCFEELLEAETDINAIDSTGFTALLQAISTRRHDYVKKLIAAGADVNMETAMIPKLESNAQVVTPLMYSISTGSANCLKELLDAGANVLFKNESGITPLISAVYRGNKAMVQLLLEAGSDINAENDNGEAALYIAVSQGHQEFDNSQNSKENGTPSPEHMPLLSAYVRIIYLLLRAGANVNDTSTGLKPVTAHLKPKKLEKPSCYILKMLSAAGADIKEKKNTSSSSKLKSLQQSVRDRLRQYLQWVHPDKNLFFTVQHLNLPHRIQSFLLFSSIQIDNSVFQNIEEALLFKTSETDVGTELHLGTSEKDIERVLKLIEDGVDVNVQDENGMTALMIATQDGHIKLIETLINAGADINIQDLLGDTALIHAANESHAECLKKLLEFGADVNIQGEDLDTALIHAVRNNDKKSWESLLDSGANPSIANAFGDTALMLATDTEDSLLLTSRLIQAGANVNMEDNEGLSALENAARRGDIDCVMKLIEAGADVNNYQQKIMSTPLIGAVREGHVDCARELLKANADINIKKDEDGFTALMTAAQKSHDDCLKELIKFGADLNDQNAQGRTALTIAAEESALQCIETLLRAGAEVDTVYLASVAKKLLKAETDISDVDDTGSVLEDSCSEWGDTSSDMESCGSTSYVKEMPSEVKQQQRREKNEEMLKQFFKSGVTPDCSENDEDAEALKAAFQHFGWKFPPRLETLSKIKSNKDMIGVMHLRSGCPMTTKRKGRRYLATVAKGEATSLQGNKSEVNLHINKGSPERAYLMEVRTDPSSFESIIPNNECFISPIVEVMAPAETSTSSYVLRIPHCLDENDDRSKVKVRMIHENRIPAVVEVPKGNIGALFYDIDAIFIKLHTNHFTKVICTICQTPFHCRERINNLWFARFDSPDKVEIRPYFGGILYDIIDFRKDVEATVKLRYVTRGNLRTSRRDFDAESAQIKLSFQVTDKGWQPRAGLDRWNESSRAFVEEMDLLDVIGSGNIHRCRQIQPYEATTYSLQAEELETFSAISKTELTLVVEETSEQEQPKKKKKQFSSLELPIDFSRESLNEQSTESEHANESNPVSGLAARGTSKLSPREIARLGPLFSPSTLETVALQHFDVTDAQVGTFKAERREDMDGFKRDLIQTFMYTGHSRKDLYRALLEADSEGILHDVEMSEIEKLILDPKPEKN